MVSFFYCRYLCSLHLLHNDKLYCRFNQQTKHFLSVNTRHSVHLKVADMEMEEILKEWQSGVFVSDPSSHACLAVKVCSLFSRSLQCERRQLLSVNPARLIFPFSAFSTIRIIINNARHYHNPDYKKERLNLIWELLLSKEVKQKTILLDRRQLQPPMVVCAPESVPAFVG